MSSIVLALILGAAVSNAQSITALTTSQIDSYNSYTYYASAGYCTNTQTLAWDCGSACSLASTHADDLADDSDIQTANCEANPDFQPVASGGNGDSVQYCKYYRS